MEKRQKAYFITIEGSEGVGKSTALSTISELLKMHAISFIATREPGGTPIAEQIRSILLSHHQELMCEDTELLLMFAGRAQHLFSVIKPALLTNKWVICDRFTDASFAYQGGGRGLPDNKIAQLEHFVQQGLRPNLTLLLDASPDICLQRALRRSQPDRFENEKIDFFKRVREKYLQRASEFPDQFRIIDASKTLEQVQKQIETTIKQVINEQC